MPSCAPGWCGPMAGRLATQCLPPSVVRSIHDRTVVLWPAYPEIAAMPVSRPGNAMAKAWYLPCSSPGICGGLPGVVERGVLPGEPVGLDGVAVACEALVLVTRPAGPRALTHPASTTAATIATGSAIGSLLIRRLQEQMTHPSLGSPQVRRGCYRTENQPGGLAPARARLACPGCPVLLIMRYGQRAELRCLRYLRRLRAPVVSPIMRQIDARSMLSHQVKEPVTHLGETPTRMPHIRAPALVWMRQDTSPHPGFTGDDDASPRAR
jgi:hypothetical protein